MKYNMKPEKSDNKAYVIIQQTKKPTDYSLTELYNIIAKHTIVVPRTKNIPICTASKISKEKIVTRIIETADAKLLCRLSKCFITRDM
jgi:hypothetical protein